MHPYDEEVKKMTPPQLAAVTAVGASALAFALKWWLARTTGVAAVGAAAYHVLAGLFYALLMLGILYTPEQQEADEDISEAEREYLQYQSGVKLNVKRSEAVMALIGSMALLGVAYWVFNRVLSAQQVVPQRVTLGLVLLAVAFFVMQFLGRFTYRIGVEHNAPGLVASSFHARTDAFATLLAALGLITQAMGFGVGRLIATLIGLLLVADAAQLFVDATRRLVGLEEDGPTAQLPFWVRLRDALRIYAESMPPLIRWMLRYEDAMSPAELRQSRRVALAFVFGCYLCSGFRIIPLGEMGGVKVFGRYVALANPGLHWAPWPIAEVRVAPVDRVQRVTVGFTLKENARWASHLEDRPEGEMLWNHAAMKGNELLEVNSAESKFMLGDTTQVETHVALTYSVRPDAVTTYLFGLEKPEQLVQRATQEAVQAVMSTRKLDQVIVEKRADIELEVARLVQAEMDRLKTGIQVETCLIRSIHPPVEVLDAFVDVASALEDKERDINIANAYARGTVELAKGEATRDINVASGEKVQRVGSALGETAAFRELQGAVEQDADAVRARLSIESMERILSDKKKVVLPRAAGRGGHSQVWFSAQPPPAAGMVAPETPPAGEEAPPPAQVAPEAGGAAPAPEGGGAPAAAPSAPAAESGGAAAPAGGH